MYETRKSNRVRRKAMELYSRVFRGRVLDVGCGPDPISAEDFPAITEVVPFDEPQGNANLIDTYFPLDSFDCVYSSQFIEHAQEPHDILRRMIALTKPGGYIVGSVPDFVLYENSIFPSRFNPTHISVFGMVKPNRQNGVGMFELVNKSNVEILLVQLCDTNYDYTKDKNIDQTYNEADGVECWLEFVLRKK